MVHVEPTTARTNSCPVQSKIQYPILSILAIVSLYGYSSIVVTVATSDLTACQYTRRICLQNRQTHLKLTYGNNACFTKTNGNPMSFCNKRFFFCENYPCLFLKGFMMHRTFLRNEHMKGRLHYSVKEMKMRIHCHAVCFI